MNGLNHRMIPAFAADRRRLACAVGIRSAPRCQFRCRRIHDDGRVPGVLAGGRGRGIQDWKQARRSYENKLDTYWEAVEDKRQARKQKRTSKLPFTQADYVMQFPPAYSGPKLSQGLAAKYAKFLSAQELERTGTEARNGRPCRLSGGCKARLQFRARAGERKGIQAPLRGRGVCARAQQGTGRAYLCARDGRHRHLRHAGRHTSDQEDRSRHFERARLCAVAGCQFRQRTVAERQALRRAPAEGWRRLRTRPRPAGRNCNRRSSHCARCTRIRAAFLSNGRGIRPMPRRPRAWACTCSMSTATSGRCCRR